MSLKYYYNTNIYQATSLLLKGFIYDYYKVNNNYGKGIYLTENQQTTNINNIILTVELKSLYNILIIDNYNQLINNFLKSKVVSTISININNPSKIFDGYKASIGDIITLSNQENTNENGDYIFMGEKIPLQKTINILTYINNNGITHRVGEKFIKPLIKLRGYNGIKIVDEKILIVYNINEIKYIKINEN